MKRLRSQVKSCLKTETVEIENSETLRNHHHALLEEEIRNLREKLINWYDINKRDLQWRDLAKHIDPNIRGYSGTIICITFYTRA
jgi:hypothetical protein